MADEYADEVDEKTIVEEYKVWKKNVPYLYDTMITHALDWPSLTTQWLPDRTTHADNDYSEHKLILGTHTSGDEPNYLMIAEVLLPSENAVIDATKYDEERGELGGYGLNKSKVKISVRIVHDREVNRARYCPQNSFLIATKSPSSDVLIFDYGKHPSKPREAERNICKPQLRLKGHEAEGYGLAWSHMEPGKIASAGDDKLVCLWDIAGSPVFAAGGAGAGAGAAAGGAGGGVAGATLGATRVLKGHSEVVEDVAWHRFNPHLLASCGDDKIVNIWDVRDASSTAAKTSFQAHDGDVMSVSFNPFAEHLLLTGATDKTVRLWDARKTATPVHTFAGHMDDVTNVMWAPFTETVFASCGADRKVVVWDCARIGEEQSEEDAADGPPELLFMHGGHTAKVSDFSWSETEEWVLASVGEDNVVQIWAMAEGVYADEDSDEEEDEEAASGAAAGGAKGGAGAGAGAGAGSSTGVGSKKKAPGKSKDDEEEGEGRQSKKARRAAADDDLE